MKRTYVFFSFILLGIFSICAFSGDEQSFSISKTVQYDNNYVRLALNTNTGDVLVAWLNIKTPDNKRFYAALCKLSKSGKFRVKKARMLSGTEAFIDNFDIAYNPLDNSYLAVCDAHEGGPTTATNLYSLKLNSKGKPVDGALQLTETGKDYVSPAIIFVTGIPAAPTILGNGDYLMAYDRPAKSSESEQAGVYTTFLDADGKMAGTVPQLVSPEINWLGYERVGSYPLEFTELEGGGYVLALLKKTVSGNFGGFLLRLDPFGQAIKQLALGDYVTMYVEFIQLSKKICMLSWDHFGNDIESYNQLYRPGLQKVRKQFYPLADGTAYFTELVKLNKDAGGYQLSNDGQYMVGRYVNKRGKLGPKTVLLFDHQGLLYMMNAVCLPDSNRIFVAWVEKEGALDVGGRAATADDYAEVKGYVFDAK